MDILSPQEKVFSDSIQGFSFLIADPSASRRSIRKLLSQLLVKGNKVEMVDNYNEAIRHMEVNRPHVVFADYDLGGRISFELLDAYRKTTADYHMRSFFMIATKESSNLVSTAAEENVDAVLLKPFTFDQLKNLFMQVMTDKIKPSPYMRALEEGKRQMVAGNHDVAVQIFQKARLSDPKPALACYYEGNVYLQSKRLKEALACFDIGLKFVPDHFRCMLGRLDSLIAMGDYVSAYSAGRTVATYHSIPLKRIPELIRLSILNKKFDDVLGFYQYADLITQLDETVSMHLASGLVVCGLHFMQINNAEAAVAAFRKAEVASKGHPKVLKRILCSLISAGLENDAQSFMSRMPPDIIDSTEVHLAELEFYDKSKPAAQALEIGMKLLAKGIKDFKLYDVAIRKSIELKRKRSILEDLSFKAITAFPDKREHFENLIKAYRDV